MNLIVLDTNLTGFFLNFDFDLFYFLAPFRDAPSAVYYSTLWDLPIIAELHASEQSPIAKWIYPSQKFGNHVTVHRPPAARPSVRTTGKSMFDLTLSS